MGGCLFVAVVYVLLLYLLCFVLVVVVVIIVIVVVAVLWFDCFYSTNGFCLFSAAAMKSKGSWAKHCRSEIKSANPIEPFNKGNCGKTSHAQRQLAALYPQELIQVLSKCQAGSQAIATK